MRFLLIVTMDSAFTVVVYLKLVPRMIGSLTRMMLSRVQGQYL